jgi:hypothetical protein
MEERLNRELSAAAARTAQQSSSGGAGSGVSGVAGTTTTARPEVFRAAIVVCSLPTTTPCVGTILPTTLHLPSALK